MPALGCLIWVHFADKWRANHNTVRSCHIEKCLCIMRPVFNQHLNANESEAKCATLWQKRKVARPLVRQICRMSSGYIRQSPNATPKYMLSWSAHARWRAHLAAILAQKMCCKMVELCWALAKHTTESVAPTLGQLRDTLSITATTTRSINLFI